MTKVNLSKSEIEQRVKEIFTSNPSSKDIKKAKTLAMSKNIKLGKYRKLFCKKCLTFFNSKNSEIKIKNGFKIIKCKNCDYVGRWKIG